MSEYIVELNENPTITVDGWSVRCDDWLVQREEIVRCRDCTEFAFGDIECATVDWCDYWGGFVESPDGYCAWGERRER